jgi:hypothetical protein
VPKILSKKKNDISWIDAETGKVICTFNQCRKKFVEASEEITKTIKWHPEPVVQTIYYHKCSECGRQVRSKNDSSKSYGSYLRAVATGNGTDQQRDLGE